MISAALTSTGTPARTSEIMRPLETSLTESASRQYFSGAMYWSHLSTAGIELRLTKKPAKAIWNRFKLHKACGSAHAVPG